METKETQITQALIDATGEPIERAVICSDVDGLIFLQVFGGLWTVHNSSVSQTLRGRWQSLEEVRAHLIKRGIMERK